MHCAGRGRWADCPVTLDGRTAEGERAGARDLLEQLRRVVSRDSPDRHTPKGGGVFSGGKTMFETLDGSLIIASHIHFQRLQYRESEMI